MDGMVVLIVHTLIVLWVFLGMTFSYTLKRANRHYAAGKIKAPSVKYFSRLSKVLFVSNMLLTLLSFWYVSPYMLPIFSSDLGRAAGVSLVLFGFVMLKKSFGALGNNYSPMFDAFFPRELVTAGVYQRVRHPIYLYNLCVSFGLALASGLGVVLISSLIGFAFVLRAIHVEETYLMAHFDQYADYKKRTNRLVPFLF